MKILSPDQIYQADKFTIEKQEISSEELMERAAIGLFNWLHQRLEGAPVLIHLFCGIGNNGGDGVALARHLLEHGYHIKVYVVNYSEKRSQEFLNNLDKLKSRKVWPEFLEEGSDLPEIGNRDILVDAIFGIGLNRPPAPWVARLIQHMNGSGAFVVAVDVPSGLFADREPAEGSAVKAQFTLAIQAPKLVFFLPGTGRYTEAWDVIDIGLDPGFLQELDATYQFVGLEQVRPWYRPRQRFSHKGTFGHSVLIGGSYGKTGAIRLAAEACLKAGSGMVTALVPDCAYTPLQTGILEVMLLAERGERELEDLQFDLEAAAVGIGPGLGTASVTAKAFATFLEAYSGPLVVDADGLNLLAKAPELLEKLPPNTILTPHPGELKRLVGEWKDDFEKLEKAQQFATKYGLILVLKGSYSITLHAGKGFVNSTGNPGMATAGSGDVLTGVITALLAQGYDPLKAAVFGVFLHGQAGDIRVADTGYEALVASDLVHGLGAAYLSLNPQANSKKS